MALTINYSTSDLAQYENNPPSWISPHPPRKINDLTADAKPFPKAPAHRSISQNTSRMPIADANANAYWKENIRYLAMLLTIWFLVSYGAGILFKSQLDTFRLGGFKLGFWFAQQGSIYVFVVLIFVYVRLMNRLDKKYGYDEI